jgi:hypothetical protein
MHQVSVSRARQNLTEYRQVKDGLPIKSVEVTCSYTHTLWCATEHLPCAEQWLRPYCLVGLLIGGKATARECLATNEFNYFQIK